MKAWRLGLDLLRVAAHLLLGTLIIWAYFPWATQARREALIAWWARIMVRLFGLQVTVAGDPHLGTRGHMLVLNHISWIDIYVTDVYRATRFVAKSDIRGWPLIGWLCEKTDTIFIERTKRRAVHGAIKDVTEVLRQGAVVGVFPEGTTTDGSRLLPFHANLLQAAIDACVPIVPGTIEYFDAAGRRSAAPAYIDDLSLWQSVKRILLARPVTVKVTLFAPIEPDGQTRQALAAASRSRIAAHLGLAEVDAKALL